MGEPAPGRAALFTVGDAVPARAPHDPATGGPAMYIGLGTLVLIIILIIIFA